MIQNESGAGGVDGAAKAAEAHCRRYGPPKGHRISQEGLEGALRASQAT
jgi:hypothetical protein